MTKRKAFTLVELLVVVIVVGILAGVAVPKFSRVLETRKTTEAEQLLAAVRTEQERRCIAGKQYVNTPADLPVLAGAGQSSNYTYSLKPAGMEAQSKSKGYSLVMPSYKEGALCCSGEYCASLSKNYPLCDDTVVVDECAAEATVQDPCTLNPNSCSCTAYANNHKCECSGNCTPCELDATSCECNPNQAKCCTADQQWNGTSCEKKQCQTSYGTAEKTSPGALDKCPGNDAINQYTCDGTYADTCTDVYSSGVVAGFTASTTKDPFTNFRNTILLAAGTYTIDKEVTIDKDDWCPHGACACCTQECCNQYPGITCAVGTPGCEGNSSTMPVENTITIVEPELPSVQLTVWKRQVTCCGNEEPLIVDTKKCAQKDKPSATKTENNCSYSRTVSCVEGTWTTGSWVKGDCTFTTCDGSKKPSSQTVACGNCNKGTMTKRPVCNGTTWGWEESACVISADVCTPGAVDSSRGKTCTSTSSNGKIETILPADDRVAVTDELAIGTIDNETVSPSQDIYTYKSGATCSSSCTWVDNNCPSNGGGGGGGGGGGKPDCGLETRLYNSIDDATPMCRGYATIDTCTGDIVGWTDNGMC